MPDVRCEELTTKRLRLRRWRDSDRSEYAALNADPRVRRWYPGPLDTATSNALIDRFEAQRQDTGFALWAVEVTSSGKGPAPFVGALGLQVPSFPAPFEHHEPLVEIAWQLHPDWWGMGIATEGADAAMKFGLATCGLAEVVAFTVPPNIASQAVMQRIGMRYDGVFTHPLAQGAWWGPHVLYRSVAECITRSAGDQLV